MLAIGTLFKGYCKGIFGRDPDWEGMRVEGYGIDWIVARGCRNDRVYFTAFSCGEDLLMTIAEIFLDIRQSEKNGEWWAVKS